MQTAPSVKPNTTAFKYNTTRTLQPLQDVPITQLGVQTSTDLLQMGYLSYVLINVFGKITTGTSPAGTFDANYWPYNLLNRLILRTNEGLEIYSTPGYHNLFAQMYHRIGFNPAVPVNPLSFNSGANGPRTSIGVAPAAGTALVASTVYPIKVSYLIPVVSHPDLRAGLLLLQNQTTRLTVSLQVGQVTDFAGAGATLGVGGTVSLTARMSQEVFSVPADPGSQPDTTFVHRIITDTQPWTASGDQVYKLPVNGTILRVCSDFNNAGVPALFYGTAGDPTTANFGNTTVQYAGSQKPEIEDFAFRHYRQRMNYAQDLPNGMILFDFAVGGGSPEMGADSRDVYDTQSLTEFAVITNTSLTPGANSKIFQTRQELQIRSQ